MSYIRKLLDLGDLTSGDGNAYREATGKDINNTK